MSKDIEMPEHVCRQKESGLTIWAYCQQNGVAYHSMQYWIKKMRKQKPLPVGRKKDLFIELTPSSTKEDFNKEALGVSPPSHPQIELSFPSGLVVKIYG
jgi:hypothetical protein